MKKIGYVILCRYSSSRLPGKILMQIEGKPVIKYIWERLVSVVPEDDIVIATSTEKSDDPIFKFAKENKIAVYRGDLKNVAERFYQSSNGKDWDYIARINGDNVFLDTELLKMMIRIVNDNDYDFVSNVKNRTFPKGMSIEIVKKEYYGKLLPKIEKEEEYYEHVTSYLYQHDSNENFHYVYNDFLPEAAGIQLALDTQEDFERTESIIREFNSRHINYNLKEIYNFYKQLNYG